MDWYISRRSALMGAASSIISLFGKKTPAQALDAQDSILVDDAPLGEMGNYDATFLGPPSTKAPRGPFVFPADADSPSAYGIDISHYTDEVPWSDLKAKRVNYVYIKSSQAEHSRDAKFEQHWKAALAAGVPRGAFHWLTPGISGKTQGEYFASRIKSAGGLAKGDLQPVIDLEWDYLGPNFKRVVLSNTKVGGKTNIVYKDYWSDLSSDQIASTVNDCLSAIVQAFPSLNIKPVVYTNRSWWDERLAKDVRFKCSVWPSDYRLQSYKDGVPRLIVGHTYNLWQFTEKGSIDVGGKHYGPFDCNKIIKGKIDDFLIS